MILFHKIVFKKQLTYGIYMCRSSWMGCHVVFQTRW